MQPINIHDYEVIAQQKLDKTIWDYFQGGSDDEVTLRANRSVFERLRLRPRMLVDVSVCKLATTVLDIPVSMPVLVAPTAFHGLVHPDGECATARAAGASNALMIVSTTASYPLEEVARAATGPLWFQLYVHTRQTAQELVQRAEQSGYRAIVLTVDTPRLGNRERDRRNAFNSLAIDSANHRGSRRPYSGDTLNWEFVSWLRSCTSLPLLVKGILTAEDALLAVEHGAAGIIVSNHGGRQLDSCLTSIEALPEIVEAVGGRCEVYCDGGIRRGTDVLKALALGAKAVCIGRPIIWGLAANGQAGVQHVLELLRAELELALALVGCPDIKDINRSYVRNTA